MIPLGVPSRREHVLDADIPKLARENFQIVHQLKPPGRVPVGVSLLM
jgi:hypothetical protein